MLKTGHDAPRMKWCVAFLFSGASECLNFGAALDRYLAEVTPTKKAATQRAERLKAKPLREFFGSYAMAAIGVDLVARYRDERLASASQRIDKASVLTKPPVRQPYCDPPRCDFSWRYWDTYLLSPSRNGASG